MGFYGHSMGYMRGMDIQGIWDMRLFLSRGIWRTGRCGGLPCSSLPLALSGKEPPTIVVIFLAYIYRSLIYLFLAMRFKSSQFNI